MSIHPEWIAKIASGEKTVEVRKTAPLQKTPFRVYIYQTKPKSGDWNDLDGRVVGEFLCKQIWEINTKAPIMIAISMNSCVPITDLQEYAGSRGWIYGWEIFDVRMYEKPVSLENFYRYADGGKDIRPCQNGKPCEYEVYDYSEDCMACKIDFDGTDCPFLRVQRPPQSWMYVEEKEAGT